MHPVPWCIAPYSIILYHLYAQRRAFIETINEMIHSVSFYFYCFDSSSATHAEMPVASHVPSPRKALPARYPPDTAPRCLRHLLSAHRLHDCLLPGVARMLTVDKHALTMSPYLPSVQLSLISRPRRDCANEVQAT